MAIIVTQPTRNAYHIRDEFRSFDRDYYPMGVYQAIYDLIQETYGEDEPYELDVIAWCCDLSETTMQDCDILEHGDIAGLAYHLSKYTTILYVDYDNDTIYHLSY